MQTHKSPLADALLPLVRQRALAALLAHTDEELHLREIARRTRMAPATVQREVLSLTRAGILRRREVGRQVFYRPDPDCPIIPELRSLIAKTVGIADVVREALEPLGDLVECAEIFGSVAAGAADNDSDLDLLVIGDATLAELIVHLRGAQSAIRREINIVNMDARAFADAVGSRDQFLTNVLNAPRIAVKGNLNELAGSGRSEPSAAASPVGAGDRRPLAGRG